MKIVLFVPVLDQPGGTEIATSRLAQQLAKRGHSVTLLTTQALSAWRQQRHLPDYTKGYQIIRLPVWQRNRQVFRRMLEFQAAWTLPVFLRGTQILHLRGLTPETLDLARIGKRLGMKTLCVPMASGLYGDVATFPTHIPHESGSIDRISGLTDALRSEVIEWGYPAERTTVIPNGVDTSFFHPAEQPPDASHVIFVGQFRPEKRIRLLLTAWQQVAARCPGARLTLVGGGHNLPEYEQLAAKLRVTATFIPNTDTFGVLKHLQSSSIFVQPGVSEGMSNALLEAMAVGLAPVVSDTPANRAVISTEIDGLMYRADSPDALAAQLERLILDHALRQQIGTAARETIMARFALDGVTDQYIALYSQLLGEAHSELF